MALRRFIDIGSYWPKDSAGNPRSLNYVWQSAELNPRGIGRHTLEKAMRAELTGCKIDTLYDLMAVCEHWSGVDVVLDEIVVARNVE